MEKVLIFDSDKCTGCRVCELVCSMTHWGEFNPKKSYIKILKNKEMDLNIAALGVKCDFCEKCVQRCLPNAITFMASTEAALAFKGKSVGMMPAPLMGG